VKFGETMDSCPFYQRHLVTYFYVWLQRGHTSESK